MKLLLCRQCTDVIRLQKYWKSCECGETSGRYEEDGLNAVYCGEDAVPLGFVNSEFRHALENQPEEGEGKRFTAFVIPKKCPTMKKIVV